MRVSRAACGVQYIICEITKSVYIEVIIILHTEVLFIMHLYILYE
jgi:hypothetical protein